MPSRQPRGHIPLYYYIIDPAGLFLFFPLARFDALVRRGAPAVERQALHRAEYTRFEVGVRLRQHGDELLDLLPLRVLVGRARIVHDGQVVLRRERAHHALCQIEHGADLRHAGPIEVRHRLEAADPSLEQQAHQERLDGVVIVVAERHLGKALLQQRLIQRPAAHLGAQRAGIGLFALLEHDSADLGLFYVLGHVQFLAQRRPAA